MPCWLGTIGFWRFNAEIHLSILRLNNKRLWLANEIIDVLPIIVSSSCRAFIAKRFFHYRRSFQQKAEQKKQPSNYFLSRRSNPTIAFDDAAKKIRENFATRHRRFVQPFSTGFGNLFNLRKFLLQCDSNPWFTGTTSFSWPLVPQVQHDWQISQLVIGTVVGIRIFTRGWHSTEVAFALLTQQPQVRFSAFPRFILMLSIFIDST